MFETTHGVAVNVALLRPAMQIDTYLDNVASLAITDGNLTTFSCTLYSSEPWLSIDLGVPLNVARVCVTNDHNQTFGQLRLTLLFIIKKFNRYSTHKKKQYE